MARPAPYQHVVEEQGPVSRVCAASIVAGGEAGEPQPPQDTGTGTGARLKRPAKAPETGDSGDPLTSNVADPDSERILFQIAEPQFNHNSGQVAFGPDGLLYWTLGDGGGANDSLDDPVLPHGLMGNGQNVETALGSVLRIDVDSVPDEGLTYAIPPDSPFADGSGAREIYAYGFRNPYRLSFDDGPSGDGTLYVADVGQDLFEEVSIVERGGNYGWVIREGFHCFDPFDPANPPATCADVGPLGEPLREPILEYDHSVGLAIIGGLVYRGSANGRHRPARVGDRTG